MGAQCPEAGAVQGRAVEKDVFRGFFFSWFFAQPALGRGDFAQEVSVAMEVVVAGEHANDIAVFVSVADEELLGPSLVYLGPEESALSGGVRCGPSAMPPPKDFFVDEC